MSNPLITEDIKKIILEETGQENISDFILNALWETVVSYIGYDPMLQEREEYIEGNGTDRLYLKARPIKSVEEIIIDNKKIDPIPKFTERYLMMYTVKEYEKYEVPVMYDHDTTNDIYIKYTAGYETLPNQLLLACILLLNNTISSLGEEGNLKSYKINTISYTFKDFSEKSLEFKSYLKPFVSVV